MYILTALVAPLIVQGTHIRASAIVVESCPSFLGAGTPPIRATTRGRFPSAFTMPVFWLGFLLVRIFAGPLGWFPVQGYSPLSRGPWPFLRQLILPALTADASRIILFPGLFPMLTVLSIDLIGDGLRDLLKV